MGEGSRDRECSRGGHGGGRRKLDGDVQEGAAPPGHGHALGDHASHHADIGIKMNFLAQGSKMKTVRVTLCQNKNSITL